ncbi:unnamed protein product [Clonostachys rhizophaga]|uniref:Uncharacterized protein n=1 Tax=Clonostachys rhizophaga TaxID=160324 RepID=A0A9N9V0B2_9HYPO|nr:unnamed protein product [Clonostachys rhizophaga]
MAKIQMMVVVVMMITMMAWVVADTNGTSSAGEQGSWAQFKEIGSAMSGWVAVLGLINTWFDPWDRYFPKKGTQGAPGDKGAEGAEGERGSRGPVGEPGPCQCRCRSSSTMVNASTQTSAPANNSSRSSSTRSSRITAGTKPAGKNMKLRWRAPPGKPI